MVSLTREKFDLHDRRDLLLLCDVLRMRVFWREEVAGVEQLTSRHLILTHRQRLHWQVGFLFWGRFQLFWGGGI